MTQQFYHRLHYTKEFAEQRSWASLARSQALEPILEDRASALLAQVRINVPK